MRVRGPGRGLEAGPMLMPGFRFYGGSEPAKTGWLRPVWLGYTSILAEIGLALAYTYRDCMRSALGGDA
jgi:hypothetical protein